MNTLIMIVISLFIFLFPYFGRRKYSRASLSSISISLGLFGTFIGIIYGLLQLDADALETSVPQLLEGLKIAFLCTLIGLCTSLVLKLFPSFYGIKAQPETENDPATRQLFELLSEIKENTARQSPSSEKHPSQDNRFPQKSEADLKSLEQEIRTVNSQLQHILHSMQDNHNTLASLVEKPGITGPDYEKLLRVQLEKISGLVKSNEDHLSQQIHDIEEKRQQEIEQLENFTNTLLSIVKKLSQDHQALHKNSDETVN